LLKIEELKELIQLIDDSSIDEFEYEIDNSKVVLRKSKEGVIPQTVVQAPIAPQAQPVQSAAVQQDSQGSSADNDNVDQRDDLHEIASPMVGTFYAKPSPDKDNFVKVGNKVSDSTVVCIIEAMKLFNELEADIKGEIVDVLVEDGQLVEYGQPLFLVKTE